MENQPPEIILQQLEKLDYKELNNLCATNRNIKNICDRYKGILYKNLITRDFGIGIDDPKTLYIIFNTLKKQGIEFFDIKRHFSLYINAIDENDLDAIIRLSRIININAKNRSGDTPLYYALRNTSPIETIRLLIDRGANINKLENGSVPLNVANSDAAARLLIEKGADVKAYDKNGRTFVMIKTMTRNKELIKLALKGGANINAEDKIFKRSALIYALLESLHYIDESLVNFLLDHNADVNVVDSEGNTPLSLAIKSKLSKKTIDRIKKADLSVALEQTSISQEQDTDNASSSNDNASSSNDNASSSRDNDTSSNDNTSVGKSSSSKRKSPTESAKNYSIGTVMVGNDGKKWVVKEDKNGRKSWRNFKE